MKEDKRYKASVSSGVQATRKVSDDYINADTNNTLGNRIYSREEGENGLVMIYEIWDLQNKMYYVIDEYNLKNGTQKEFLVERPWPYEGLRGFPFEVLVFNHDPDSPFGLSDAKVWHNPTLAMNLVHSMRFNHIKRFNRKYETPEGNLDPEEMDKLTSPYDGAIIKNKIGQPGQSTIIPIMDAPMSPDIYNFLQDMRRENEVLSGVTETKKGQDSSHKTATEASIMESGSSVRESDRSHLVTKFVERIVRKIDQLNVSYLDRSYAAFVTDPETAMVWTEQPDEILKMEAEVKIRVGSSTYKSKEVQIKQLLDFLNMTDRWLTQ